MRKQVVFVVLLILGGAARVQKCPAAVVFRSFDGPELAWQFVDARADAWLTSHGCVGDDARQGSGAERLTIEAPAGEALHFVCPVGRLPVLDELEARLWVKATRPGVALAARVVLPRSVDSKTGEPRTALVTGEQCELPGRWQQLRLSDVPRLLEAKARVMRAAHVEAVDTHEAYVDAIVLVIPGGEGATTVWTDALEVDGVVMPAVVATTGDKRVAPAAFSAPLAQAPAKPPLSAPATAVGRFEGTILMVEGRPFLMRGIEWNNEPLAFLAARGFNTIWLDDLPTPEQSAEARRAGLWLISIPPGLDRLSAQGIDPALDRVLAWNLGSPAGPRDLEQTRRWAEAVRSRDPQVGRPIIVAPRGDWLPASRLADALVADHPAAANLPPADFVEWLQTLPLLARPGTPLWVRIPSQPGTQTKKQLATLAPSVASARTLLDELQIAALAEAAAINGCRGFLVQSNSPLDAADEATQRRALVLETLNDRLDTLGPWLTIGKRIGDATASDSTATAVVLQAERARLLVPTFTTQEPAGSKSPPSKSVAFIVPGVPESNKAFLLSPVALSALETKRVAGGVRVVLDRGAGGVVLLTEDPEVITGYRQRIAERGARNAQRTFALATARSRSLTALASQLQRIGVGTKTADKALAAAGADLRGVNALLAAGKSATAYEQSAAAAETLAEALAHVRLDADQGPALQSAPASADVGSLVWRAGLEKALAALGGGENLLAGGDFEDLAQLRRLGWQHVEDPLGGVETKVQLSGHAPHEGRYSLEISADAASRTSAPQIVARPIVWITSPPTRAKAGDVLEISGWVRVSEPITGSINGLEIVDSLGGQELALRVRSTSDWQPFRLIRSAPDTTNVTLTFALEGLGSASIDGVMIRSLKPKNAVRLPMVKDDSGPAFPSAARRPVFGPPVER